MGKSRSCVSCHQAKSPAINRDHAIQNWPGQSPHPEVRKFTTQEQQKINKVGVCLECHQPKSGFYKNFNQRKQKLLADPALESQHKSKKFTEGLLYQGR